MTDSREQIDESENLSAGDVESAQPSASQGGWAGRETAGLGQEREHERHMTREEWIAYQVENAPEITPDAWRKTLRLLRGARRPRAESG